MSSRKEIRDEILDITDQESSQKSTLVNDSINATLLEIQNPGWAFSSKNETHHNWSWLKRKTSFSTVANQEDYIIGRDIDNIAIVRQTTSPAILEKWSDERFYKEEPYPTDTGNPRIYREWGVNGVSVKLAEADTIDVVSSSASDDGDSELAVSVTGYVGGIFTTETYTLDGTTTVSGTKTFQARELLISKQKNTTGTITVTEHSGATTLLTLGPSERVPIFKVISLFPIPSSAITIYVHYYTHIKTLENDSDSPPFAEKWHYVVRLGALSKMYFHLNKEESALAHYKMYASAVRAMIAEDKDDVDLKPQLWRRHSGYPSIYLRRSDEAIS